MPAKRNPLNLNPLQLKTLTLLQELARMGEVRGIRASLLRWIWRERLLSSAA